MVLGGSKVKESTLVAVLAMTAVLNRTDGLQDRSICSMSRNPAGKLGKFSALMVVDLIAGNDVVGLLSFEKNKLEFGAGCGYGCGMAGGAVADDVKRQV
ncbi:hypothetical protein U1Q18_012852 [Sarracenia purpurea var. burkii]